MLMLFSTRRGAWWQESCLAVLPRQVGDQGKKKQVVAGTKPDGMLLGNLILACSVHV